MKMEASYVLGYVMIKKTECDEAAKGEKGERAFSR